MDIGPIVPDAPWFWGALQRHCVPDCCGIGAYDLTPQSVRWACGADWRAGPPGDPALLAVELRQAAHAVRSIDVEVVSARLFQEFLVPESYAQLFVYLASTIEATRQS